MNFNIVSPYDSAHNFTARFKEEVQIPKNSSVYLNYAKIERDRRIVLQEDNTIELLYENPIPKYIQATPTVETMAQVGSNHTINIPKGTYSATSLAEEINKRFQTLYNRSSVVQNTLGMYNCGSLNILNFRESSGAITELVNNRGESGILLSIIQNQLDAVFANAPKDLNDIQPLNAYLNVNFIIDPQNHTNDITNGGNQALGACYSKQATVAAAIAYDNYAISQSPMQHYALKTYGIRTTGTSANQSMFVSGGNDIEQHIETCPRLWATTRRNLDNINTAQEGGREFCGLYSQPYARGSPQISPANLATMGFSTNVKRTRGTQANNGVGNENPHLTDGVPCCYFGVEVGGLQPGTTNYRTLRVYGCGQDVGGDATAPIRANEALFRHGGAKIDRMILLKTIILNDQLDGGPLVSDDDVVSFAIIPYYKSQYLSGRNDSPTESVYKGFVNRSKLYFAVCLKTTSSGWREVYDSGDAMDPEWYIFGTLLEGANTEFTTTQSEDMINMNAPFHPFLSSTSVNGGWGRVSYTAFERGPAAAPRVLIDSVRFKFSRELSSYIDSSKTEVAADGQSIVSQYTSHPIYPTLPHYERDFFPILPFFQSLGKSASQQFAGLVALTEMYADTSDDAYVIYVNNLPLKNYKNTRNSRLVNETKGGYNKNILANVPLPYQTQYLVDNRLIGYYEPYLKAISDMKNQNFKTNYFDIEIRNALDDSPASYLRSAVINFTIVDKKSKLIN